MAAIGSRQVIPPAMPVPRDLLGINHPITSLESKGVGKGVRQAWKEDACYVDTHAQLVRYLEALLVYK